MGPASRTAYIIDGTVLLSPGNSIISNEKTVAHQPTKDSSSSDV